MEPLKHYGTPRMLQCLLPLSHVGDLLGPLYLTVTLVNPIYQSQFIHPSLLSFTC